MYIIWGKIFYNLKKENVMEEERTIAAISTPIGVGGISVIRLSGKNALKIANKVFNTTLKIEKNWTKKNVSW